MNKKFDLSSIKLALEHASFKSFVVRDNVNTLLKAIELDLEEIGFEPSDNTVEVVEALENSINELEGQDKPHIRINENDRVELDTEEDDGVIEVDELTRADDEEEVEGHIVNVDEELDEFET